VLLSSHIGTTPYRPDIDGLRAVSILLVVLYHAQPELVSGGFIGVDVFFVISGFLITRIIMTEIKAANFSPARFYARRVRRIFPALITVLLAAYLIGWFVLLPRGFSLLGQNIVASVGFVSNLFQLTQTGYFAPDAAENPLVHLWSLGIEEQFYIFWPLALLLVVNSKRPAIWTMVIAVLSLGASIAIYFGYKDWSFYSPLPRAWELLLGAVIAEQMVSRPENSSERFVGQHGLMALAGLVLIVGAAFVLNRNSVFPGLAALPPTLGTALVIIAPEARMNRLLLGNRPMVLLGLISYPLYLWHWPLLSYLSIFRNGAPNPLEIWLAIVVAVVLAWLTFRLVETPVRRRPDVVPKLACSLLAVGVAGIVTVAAGGFDFRFVPEIRAIADLPPQNNSGFRDHCFLGAPAARFSSDCIEPGEDPLLVLWGDSTAAALYPGLKEAQQKYQFRLGRFSAPGCAPILSSKLHPSCDKPNAVAFDLIKSARPEVVLIHAQWDGLKDLGNLGETIKKLRAVPVPRIVLLGPVPVWKRTLPHALVNFYRLHHAIADRITSGVSGAEGDARMQSFSRNAAIDFISARDVLCDEDGCLTRIGPTADDVLTTDIIHLSEQGSKFLVGGIGDRLFGSPARLPLAGR
jgi:peptidoglycan/LPS O-acetylase OafA/YrhL